MKLTEILDNKNFDFKWDAKREGFATIAHGKEVKFFKAKSLFDRSGAQEDAKKLMIKLRSEEWAKQKEKEEHEWQFVRPLTKLELEYIDMYKRLGLLTDAELARWERLGKEVVRKSILDDTHPAIKGIKPEGIKQKK